MGVSLSPQSWSLLVAICISFPIRACLLLPASQVKFGSCRLAYHGAAIPEGLNFFPGSDREEVPAPCPWHSQSEVNTGRAQALGHQAIGATGRTTSHRGQTRPETLSCQPTAKPCASEEKKGINWVAICLSCFYLCPKFWSVFASFGHCHK